MNKILLTTLFSGYNYGSSLQTFATKSIIEELGCECELVARKSIVKGRDIRLGKLFTILWRTLLTVDTKTLKAYKSSYQKTLATSMGHDFVAKYNEKKLRKWISEIKHLSVREDSGVKLIKELCGREALHLLDPTLLLNGETWRKNM